MRAVDFLEASDTGVSALEFLDAPDPAPGSEPLNAAAKTVVPPPGAIIRDPLREASRRMAPLMVENLPRTLLGIKRKLPAEIQGTLETVPKTAKAIGQM